MGRNATAPMQAAHQKERGLAWLLDGIERDLASHT
jgi:hypothetical protein